MGASGIKVPPPSIAGLVLAAGGSTRMGRPKQLLMYQGQTLLRRAADAALGAGLAPVIVVIGDDPSAQLRQELANLPVHIVVNAHWRAGMGTSIRAGMQNLSAIAPPPSGLASVGSFAGVLLSLCDQPLVTAPLLGRLIEAFGSSQQSLVAAAYQQTVGVPAIFAAEHFPALLELPENSGAKPILLAHAGRVRPILMPEAATDIDDPESYDRLTARP